MASKRNVKYVEQDEPSFLKKFKERVGYKEAANINDKFSEEADSSESKTKDDDGKIEDEEPVVVVLKPGDLSAEEVAKHREEHGDTGIVRGETPFRYVCSMLLTKYAFVCFP